MAKGECFPSLTEGKEGHFFEPENCRNNKDKLRNICTLEEHLTIITHTKERKQLPSDMKTEIEHIFQSRVINVLREYLHTVNQNNNDLDLFSETIQPIWVFYLIAYHVLVSSEKENRNEILNVIRAKLPYIWELVLRFSSNHFFLLYFDMYFKNNPKDFFTNMQTIWKLDPTEELQLKLGYCLELMQEKDYKTLIQLIHHHADYFIESLEEIGYHICLNSPAVMVLLHILHHQVSINKMEKVKTIVTMLSSGLGHFDISKFILTLDNKHILGTPLLIKLLQPVMTPYPSNFLKMVLICSKRLRQDNYYTECIKFLKCHFQFVSSVPTDELTIQGDCYYRKQYCIALLLLLNEYVSCHDTHKMNLVLTKLLDSSLSFLSYIHGDSCDCFMGNKKCLNENKAVILNKHFFDGLARHANDFKEHLLCCYQRRQCGEIDFWNSPSSMRMEYMIQSSGYQDFDTVMKSVIHGKLELAPYLQSIIEMMEMKEYKAESLLFLIKFIRRSADHNTATLYNIIKTLYAFDLKPEIQDFILQGLTAYLMISYYRQYGPLSKFILDICMICPKGQFSQKLTSGIATLLLKFDDDTVNDFRKVIYKCYCTVRHDSKTEKDANIAKKYKDHYTFLASMEAEEKMEKLANLTNFLLMLTLLLITSGGHHKSAELKKYLSLKYEYRDSILYLLWCSGDVEINPGPTLSSLRKVPDSVKERNWIYEMCSVLLRLLKYKSINIRIDGLWKEKPFDWPVDSDFYDPRNKPKGKGYSIKTDRNLLENLEEQCNWKGVFEEVTQLDDEYTKSTVKQYQKEITAWRTNKANLFELYILRQELDILLEAKTSLLKYKKEPDLKEGLSNLNVDLIFDSEEDMCLSNAGYTDIVRDIAITFCRIGKGLDPLEKSDGIWKTPPTGWCPTYKYFSPCNAGKRQGKCKDKELVDHLIRCCETKVQKYCKVHKKPGLIKMLHAWKHENKQEVWKYHTIWANMEVIDHSLKYLKLEGLLAKSQTHLEKLGIKPRKFKESIHDSNDLPLCPVQDKQNYPKCQTIIQSDQENNFDHPVKLRDSDASQKVVPFTLKGIEYQETDQTTQNKTNKRKLQSTDENYTDPKKLHKSDKGKSLPIHTSPTEQCQGEPINDLTPITVLNDILDLQDESNLNHNSSSFNIPPFIRSLMTISNEDTTHAVQQETPIETIVEYLKK